MNNEAMADDPGLFVFGGGEVDFYPSVELAAGAIERVDVDAGEYEGFFTVEGERFVPRAMDEWNVELRATGSSEPYVLRRLLRDARRKGTARFSSDPDDPVAVANEMLAFQWSRRWPRWPRWLDHRLHGEAPPRI